VVTLYGFESPPLDLSPLEPPPEWAYPNPWVMGHPMDPRVRLKSAAEAQWDADVSAWGFTPEPRSKRRTPSPNRGAAAYDFAREQDPAIPPYDFIQRSIRANYVAVGGPVPGDAIHRAIAANPADFQVWIDGVQVSGPVLDPRYLAPAAIKLVSSHTIAGLDPEPPRE
jgi:hypothetical protein